MLLQAGTVQIPRGFKMNFIRIFPPYLNRDEQKLCPILIKLSAFVELLILDILIKKLFEKAFVFMEINSKHC
jgi:hypothetical protein